MSEVDRFWSYEASNIRCVRESDYDALSAELAALKAGQGEANCKPQTCNGRSCGWCKEGVEPCHYTAPPATGA